MESIFKTIWEYFPWILLVVMWIMHTLKQARIDELKQDLMNMQDEIEILCKSNREERNRFLEEVEKWKLLATAPVMEPMPQTIITSSDLERVACRSEIFPNQSHEKQIREATDAMVKYIIPFIYTELKDDNGYKTYYQELYVGTPKKLHYEK